MKVHFTSRFSNRASSYKRVSAFLLTCALCFTLIAIFVYQRAQADKSLPVAEFSYAAGQPTNASSVATAHSIPLTGFGCTPPSTVYVDDNWLGVTPGTDPDGVGPATNFGCDSFATIQGGVDGVAVSGTVNVAPGTYGENVTINKALILIGSGKGSDDTANTVLTNSGGVGITVTSSNVTVSYLRVRDYTAGGASDYGINLTGGALSNILIDHCAATNTATGIALQGTANVMTNITVQYCDLIGNRDSGLFVYFPTYVNGLTIDHCDVENNAAEGIEFYQEDVTSGLPLAAATSTNVHISNSTVSNNAVGQPGDEGFGNITVYGCNGDIDIMNTNIDATSADYGIYLRGHLDVNDEPTTGGTMTLTNVSVTGTPLDWGIHVAWYTDVELVLSNNTVNVDLASGASPADHPRAALFMRHLAASNLFDLGNTIFAGTRGVGAQHPYDLVASHADINATAVTFTQATQFGIEDMVLHRLDVSPFSGSDPTGLVRWVASNIYVTPDSGSIQSGIDAASDGDTVNIQAGTYSGDVSTAGKSVTLAAGASPGQVTINGNVTLDGNDTLAIEINGTNAATQYDNFIINGTVTLGGANLVLSGSHVPSPSQSFTIVTNDAGDLITGTFASLPEGTTITNFLGSGLNAMISYTGGDGNDAVLTVAACTPPATVYVDDDFPNPVIGQDPDGVGPATDFGCDSFATIQDGVVGVTAGGTVIVNEGTYAEGNNVIHLNKSVTVSGPNSAISPNGLTPRVAEAVITSQGTDISPNSVFVVEGTGLTVTVQGFTFAGVPAAMNAYSPNDIVTLQKNILSATHDPGMFFETPTLTINDNHFLNITTQTEDTMQIGRNFGVIRGLMSITDNVWSNVTVPGANLDTVSGTISGNTFQDVQYYGFLLVNDCGDLTITGNTFSGITNPDPVGVPTWGSGVRFYTPAVTSPVNINGNTFTNSHTGVGVRGVPNDALADITGMPIHVNLNRFINNNSGISDGAAGTLDAENNWWGCNYGAGTGGVGCTGTPNGLALDGTAVVDADPWIVLGVSASPNPVAAFGMSTVTADMTDNSVAADTTGSGTVPLMPVTFSAGAGTMAPPTGTITSGLGTSVFTSTSTVNGYACALVDNQTFCTPIMITGATAAAGSIDGHVADDQGRPVSGTVVRLSGGQERKTITDANGEYHFDNVTTAGFYTVTPSRANFRFNPAQRSFSQIGNQTEAVFTGTSMGDQRNPLDTPEYFVRQQYVDILGREPEEAGFNYWSDQILACGADAECVNARRRDVAAAFFISEEFQASGSYIYDVYAGTLGRRPAFGEYTTDRQQVVGGATLDAAKTTFARNFVLRAEFMNRYQNATSADTFVDAMLQSVQPSGVDLSSERANLIGTYNLGSDQVSSRAAVVKALADNATFKQSQYNQSFVLTEYFAYLRRDIDQDGYAFWLNVLNNREPGNYRGMVCSFITSTEYQNRFSVIASHSNGECRQ